MQETEDARSSISAFSSKLLMMSCIPDPWQTVARLKIPKQDSFSYALKNFWEDRLRVDPWMGLKSLEPLGGPNRLRKVVYPASSALRREMNATTEFHIKSLDELPAH